jgi:hypothetical protein
MESTSPTWKEGKPTDAPREQSTGRTNHSLPAQQRGDTTTPDGEQSKAPTRSRNFSAKPNKKSR